MWSFIARLIVILVVGGLVAWKGRSLCRGIEPPAGICALEARLWPDDEGPERQREAPAWRNIRPASLPPMPAEVPRPAPKPRREALP
jgi:hypothetical protein